MLTKYALEEIYPWNESHSRSQRERYYRLRDVYLNAFGSKPSYYFSVPGRTELGGNHTDHSNGIVLAAAVSTDSIAAATAVEGTVATIHSEGYEPLIVDMADPERKTAELGTPQALVRGIAARLSQLNYGVGGFQACITSDVLPGSGLSSSASFEVLIATILNYLYNDAQIPAVQIAQIGQFAENNYFGKPCGLMDQLACAYGGIISIDFRDIGSPSIEQVRCDFQQSEYRLLIVDTGSSHAGLYEDYAAIPREMRAVANALGVGSCREIDPSAFSYQMNEIISKLGDRPVLRVLHYLHENERVLQQVAALKNSKFDTFFELVRDSGDSSQKLLQNIISETKPEDRHLADALAFTEVFISESGQGVCRVHGGGFAGTIQVYLPEERIEAYASLVEAIFGDGCVREFGIREIGAVCVFGVG